jgi:hypothetical protein
MVIVVVMAMTAMVTVAVKVTAIAEVMPDDSNCDAGQGQKKIA